MKSILLTLALLALTLSLKFRIGLEPVQKTCFYQIMQSHHKYSFQVTPLTASLYDITIAHMVNGQWENVVTRATKDEFEDVEVHKLASADATYSFCVRNLHHTRLNASVEVKTGLELMEFEVLPNQGDAQNLERELSWANNQKDKFFEGVEKMKDLSVSSEGVVNMMSTTMVWLAVIGLASIIAVNVVFYRSLRQTFKARKWI